MWQGGDFPLESSWDNSVERRKNEGKKEKKEKEREKKKRGVRSFTFSLGFTEITSSVFVGARSKVRLGDESFVWGTRICGFRQILRGRGLSPTLVSLGLRAI